MSFNIILYKLVSFLSGQFLAGTAIGTSVTVEQPRDVNTPLSVKSLLQKVLAHSKQWRTIGTSLGVDIQAVIRRVSGNDEERLKAVLDEWLKKEKEASWPKFCKALERAGLKDLVKVYIHR